MKQAIINFMSSRGNLTIFQCILYGIMGYVMGQYLTWLQLSAMLVIMYLMHLITRTKAVADGMVIGHLMKEHDIQTNKFIQHMKKEMDKIDKENLN